MEREHDMADRQEVTPPVDAAEPRVRHGFAPLYPRPPARNLRVYAFDPQASKDLRTAMVNDAVISLPWEEPWEEPLAPGPVGEYLEVVDHDPASGCFYAPVDLNDPHLLAQDGLPPSEGRPQFHQQMVYAVAMKTIKLFERALGRSVVWAREGGDEEKREREEKGKGIRPHFEKKLRIYPHALREPNAYYSPEKTALLFGYFRPPEEKSQGDKWVFTCLSQDIVAHETTHAILHGLHRRSIQSSNVDTLAFHEGFADLVALFQHFTMTDVVAHQISSGRGRLRGDSLLTGLARQFGQAIGREGALRYALEIVDAQRKADEKTDPVERDDARRELRTIDSAIEPHDRGGFLVAAVFDAFVTIYERRIADLLRIATGSSTPTGVELSPDLVGRLAGEASKSADHVLRLCVRALDYIPPIDMLFGEYLRAIVTADADLVPQDPLRYRVAFAESFRKCGISVPACLSMAPDSLAWEEPDPAELPADGDPHGQLFSELLGKLHLTFGSYRNKDGKSLREQNIEIIRHNQFEAWRWLQSRRDPRWNRLLGVRLLPDELAREPKLMSIRRRDYGEGERCKVEVYATRVARRSGPDGQELSQLVIQIAQRRAAWFDPARQAEADERGFDEPPQFWFRGGATLLVDLRDGRLRHVIRKSIDNEDRLARERAFRTGGRAALAMETYGDSAQQTSAPREPFAMIHRG
jgi:hypothetical protein